MSGRRSHLRFDVIHSPEGILRVMQDVVVQRDDRGALTAISQEAGILGEIVTVDVPAQLDPDGSMRARIVGSQPLVVNGTVRHCLRLEAVGVAP